MPKSKQPGGEHQGRETGFWRTVTGPIRGIRRKTTRQTEAVRPDQSDVAQEQRMPAGRDTAPQQINIEQPPAWVSQLREGAERLAPSRQLLRDEKLRTQTLRELNTVIQANEPTGQISDTLPILSTTVPPTDSIKGLGRALIDTAEEAAVAGQPLAEKSPGGEILANVRAAISVNAVRHGFSRDTEKVNRLIAAVAIYIAPEYTKYGELPEDSMQHERQTVDQLMRIIRGQQPQATGKPEDFLL